MLNDRKRTLLHNLISLSVLQGLNYLLPLLTMPYLVRVLGVEKFGLLAFATATGAYFQVLADYGFSLSATRDISVHRDDRGTLNKIFSSVLSIQVMLLFLGLLLLVAIVSTIGRFRQDAGIFFLCFFVVAANALFPVWFFQGMERMKFITVLSLGSKVFFTCAVFVFVKDDAQYHLVPIFSGVGGASTTILAVVIIRARFGVGFSIQSWDTLSMCFRSGWQVFATRIYLNLYKTTNTVILGFFTNNTLVGYYSIADKMVTALGGLFDSANQAIYPYLAKIFAEDGGRFRTLLERLSRYFLLGSIMVCIFSFLLRDRLVGLVAGKVEPEVILIFSVLLLTVIANPFGALFTNALIILGRGRELTQVMRNTAILSLLLSPMAIYMMRTMGMAIVAVVLASYVTTMCWGKIRQT